MPKWLLIKAPETYPHPIYLDPSQCFSIRQIFMSNPLFWESSSNAHFDTHHLHSQPEEVCNAKMASEGAYQNIPKQILQAIRCPPTYTNYICTPGPGYTKAFKQSLGDSRVGSKWVCQVFLPVGNIPLPHAPWNTPCYYVCRLGSSEKDCAV